MTIWKDDDELDKYCFEHLERIQMLPLCTHEKALQNLVVFTNLNSIWIQDDTRIWPMNLPMGWFASEIFTGRYLRPGWSPSIIPLTNIMWQSSLLSWLQPRPSTCITWSSSNVRMRHGPAESICRCTAWSMWINVVNHANQWKEDAQVHLRYLRC